MNRSVGGDGVGVQGRVAPAAVEKETGKPEGDQKMSTTSQESKVGVSVQATESSVTSDCANRKVKPTTIKEFMAGCRDITQWMHQAHQPFLGYISKGVHEKYIAPLKKRHEEGTIDGRVYDIAWMSSARPILASSPAEVRQRVQTDKILTFPFGIRIGGRNVKLCKVYNDRDFEGGWIACLIMLPEEAEQFDPTWHFPA